MEPICDYGCNQPAKHIFKSGNHCCSHSTSKCPAMRGKNSSIVKLVRQERGDSFWANGHPKGMAGKTHPFRNKTYDEIYGDSRSATIKQQISDANRGNQSWHALGKETKDRLADEQRARIISRYEQGWLPKAGRCKKIRYISPVAGEVLLDGTWELAVAQYMDRNGWHWIRNTKRFPYINLKGTVSHYTPDFHVEELNGYLEVKGYETDLDRCKWSQFKESLTVWKKDVILQIMERGPDGKAAGC